MNRQRELLPVGEEVEAPQDLVSVGKIVGLFGVRGWIKVFSYTSPRENILRYKLWILLYQGRCYQAKVKEGRIQGKGIAAHLSGCDDRDTAACLIDTEIVVRRSQLPGLPRGQFYWSDLEGLRVVHRDGRELGVVDYLLETGANDVLVVQGERERLVPFVPGEVVLEVDPKAGVLRVDWDPEF